MLGWRRKALGLVRSKGASNRPEVRQILTADFLINSSLKLKQTSEKAIGSVTDILSQSK